MNNPYNKKTQLILAGVALALLLIVALVISIGQSGWIEFSAPAKTPHNKTVSIELKSEKEVLQKITLRAGESKKIRVKAGVWQASSQVDTIKSIDIVKVRGFSTTKLQTPNGELREIRQLGSNVF